MFTHVTPIKKLKTYQRKACRLSIPGQRAAPSLAAERPTDDSRGIQQ
jgi:hypothetical protein